jgi:hypothetical protein
MRQDSLTFHVRENDYFGTLATVLDLLRQEMLKQGYSRHTEALLRLRDDLVYLQRSYRIESKQSEADGT